MKKNILIIIHIYCLITSKKTSRLENPENIPNPLFILVNGSFKSLES